MATMTQARTATTTIDDAIEQIGVGRFQWRLLFVNGLTWAADAMEVLLVGFVLPSLIGAWKISATQAGYVGTATFAGMFVGAWFWGLLGDRLGRRRVFLWTVLQTAVFGTLAALSPNLWVLIGLRFLTGTAMGGTLPVDYAIMAEYLPTKDRGRFLVYLESFWALGTIMAALLAWVFIPRDPVNGWRYVVGFGAVLGLLGFWIRRSVPESPRFLLINGRADEAKAALQRVAEINGQPITIGALHSGGKAAHPGFGRLWQAGLVRKTVALSLIWFSLSLGYYGIFTWLPQFFRAQQITLLPVYEYQVLLALAQVPGYLLAAWLVERWGRKPTLVAYLLGSALFSFLFTVSTGATMIVWSGMLLSFSLLGAWGALYALTPESFPTEVRATGVGWTSAIARVAGMGAPLIGGYLLDNKLPLTSALTLYAGFFVVAGVATLVIDVETRNRRLADVTVRTA